MKQKNCYYSFFEKVVTSFSYPSEIIVDYLEPESLIKLTRVSKFLRDNIKNYQYVINKICYSKCFSNHYLIEQHMKEVTSSNQNKENRIKQFLLISQINLKTYENQFQVIRAQIIKNLNHLVDINTATQVTTRYFNIIFKPNISLPKLRRQNVGIKCTSNFQFMLADHSLATQSSQFELTKESQSLLKHIHQKKQEISTEIQEMLEAYKLSIGGQLIQTYVQTESPFLNALNLMLNGIETYLKATKSIIGFMVQNNQKYNAFIEFITRYENYRNMIIEMQESFGFLFRQFTTIFSTNHKQFEKNPFCFLWRIMIKKWINTFSELHKNNNECYNLTMLLNRQNFLNKYILDNLDEINKNSYFKYMITQNKLSEIYSSNFKINMGDFSKKTITMQNKTNSSSQSLKQIIKCYNEYLIDTSINEVTVNWCGTSSQILGTIFKQNQKSFLQTYGTYLQLIHHIFGNGQQKFKMLKNELMEINEQVHPGTLVKIINMISGIEQWSTPIYLHKTKNEIYTQISQTNLLINYINQSRNIYQNIPQENLKLLAFDNKISLKDFYSIIQQEVQKEQQTVQQQYEEGIQNQPEVEQQDLKQKILSVRKQLSISQQKHYEQEGSQIKKKRKLF